MRKVIHEVDEKRVILAIDQRRVILEDVVPELNNSRTRIATKKKDEICPFLIWKITNFLLQNVMLAFIRGLNLFN